MATLPMKGIGIRKSVWHIANRRSRKFKAEGSIESGAIPPNKARPRSSPDAELERNNHQIVDQTRLVDAGGHRREHRTVDLAHLFQRIGIDQRRIIELRKAFGFYNLPHRLSNP